MKNLPIILFCLSISLSQAQQPSFQEFGNKFKQAVASKDYKAIASMMEFPFFSFDWGYLVQEGNSQIETTEDFLKVANKIFDKKAIKTIQSEPFKFIEVEDEESYYTLIFYRSEKSAAWIKFYLVNGQWKAVGTDNVSE